MTAVEAARRSLGRVGAVLPVSFTALPSADEQRNAAQWLERAGYGTIWGNEVVGSKDVLVQLAVLLAATERVTVGTSIANIWAREPQVLHAGAAQLAEAYPGRFVLGIGVGYPQQAECAGREFGSPLVTIRDYRDRMDSQTAPPAPDVRYPRVLGANGPKMLALSAEIFDGAFPAVLPPGFTAQARQSLGSDKLLVVGLSVTTEPGVQRARAAARESVAGRLAMPSFVKNLARLGYPADAGDRTVDALIAYGGPAAIAAKVREHLDAGADHVALLPLIRTCFGSEIEGLEHLARELT